MNRDQEWSGPGRPPRVAVNDIVDIAMEMFGRRGLRGTSIAAVAAEVGLTDAGVLHHFPTKKALIDAVITRSAELQVKQMRELVAPGGLEAIRQMAAWGEVVADAPELAALMAVLSTEALLEDSPVKETIIRRYEAVHDLASGLIREGIARGEIRPDVNADDEAVEIIAFMDGLRLQWLYSSHKLPIAELNRSFFDRLVERISVEG